LLGAQEPFDIAPRGAQRRRHAHAVRVHGDADGTAPATCEAVLDKPTAKLDQQSAFCCSSIHSSASALMVLGSRPSLWIVGPIFTVTVPGRFKKALRGHSSPALCATGTTG